MDHLSHYLAYYEGTEAPGYAVLVSGDWGVGKTHQVKKIIPENKRYYISLFGINTVTELQTSVFAKMFPANYQTKMDAEKNRSVTMFGLPVGAFASQITNIFIKEKIKADRIIVFDDLERCGIGPSDLVGAINLYVEHHGCRVIVIANEGKLSDNIISHKEKVFGQTLRVDPNFTDAYEAFEAQLSRSTEILRELRKEIGEVYTYSGVPSLRVLRHVMEDTVRLYLCLTEEQKQNRSLVRETVRLLAALNFEYRSGRLERNDINGRRKKVLSYAMSKVGTGDGKKIDMPPFVEAQERYKTIDLESTVFDDEVLQQMIFDGIYENDNIQMSIQRSLLVTTPDQLPSWRAFIQFQDLPDESAEAAMERMNQDFRQRKIEDPGDMLHVFALKMMMAANNVSEQDIGSAVAECIAYIEDMRNSGRLKPGPMAWEDREDLGHGYAGYGYWVEDSYSTEFSRVFTHLRDARRHVMLSSLGAMGEQVLAVVASDGENFYSLLNHTAKGGATFAEVPVLSAIAPEAFVDAWMSSHPKNWYWIGKGIEERLGRPSRSELSEEIPWAQEVVALLRDQAAAAKPLRALRIRRSLPTIPESESESG